MKSTLLGQLGGIEVFCKAAEAGNFTSAASLLGMTPGAVSRAVSRLEACLGVRLFARTTRQVNLTEEGRHFYEQCRQALGQIEEAERCLTGGQVEPSGLLRLSVPTTWGHYRLMPLLPGFLARYPAIRVEVNVSNHNADLVEEGYDLAIRLGQPADSRLVVRKIEEATIGVYAAPAYLEQHGTPVHPDELDRHRCLPFVMPGNGRVLPWVFLADGHEIEREVPRHVAISGDVLACVSLARAGGGLVQTYRFVVEEALARGELVEILQPWAGRSRPFCLLFPHNRHLAARVRVFIDYLMARIGTP